MSTLNGQVYPRSVIYEVGSVPTAGPFDIPFPFADEDIVAVYVDGVAQAGFVVTQTSEVGTAGNTVTLNAEVSNARVEVRSETPGARLTGVTFVTQELSREVDRIYAVLQERDEILKRAPKLRPGLSGVDVKLPDPEAERLIGWNPEANGFANGPKASAVFEAQEAAEAAEDAAQGYAQELRNSVMIPISEDAQSVLVSIGSLYFVGEADTPYPHVTLEIV